MNREIKYRAWHIERKEILHVAEIRFGVNGEISSMVIGWLDGFEDEFIFDRIRPDEVELLEYTGLS